MLAALCAQDHGKRLGNAAEPLVRKALPITWDLLIVIQLELLRKSPRTYPGPQGDGKIGGGPSKSLEKM